MPVIDTVPYTSSQGPLKLFNVFTKAVESRPPGAKAAYIYCGGSWTMSRGGGGLDKWTDERQPNAGRLQLTKWRSEVEKVVLTCKSAYFSFSGVEPKLMYSGESTWHRGQAWDLVWKIRFIARDDDFPSRTCCRQEGRAIRSYRGEGCEVRNDPSG